tara:strand:- start:895 stop:1284 length:390 start_codon:yes stop_codon:yes gene_type:complete
MIRIFILFLFLIFSCNSLNPPELNIISHSELVEIQETEYILIDVRTIQEYESGFIKQAINIDFYSESFKNDILSVEKDSKVILYCRTNNRSNKTAKILLENGYMDVNVIDGGITSWVKNGNDINYSIID